MAYYRIVGTLEYEDVWYCECKWCEGHGSDKTIREYVDRVVKAPNENYALNMILNKVLPDMVVEGDCEWTAGPVICDPPPDQVMRLTGAPMLREIRKWLNGT